MRHDAGSNVVPAPEDFSVAERVIALDKASPPKGTPEFEVLRNKHAEFRAEIGGDRYALLVGIRRPRNASEQIDVRAHLGLITPEEAATLMKADAARPIDQEMLDQFCDAYEARVLALSRMLQIVNEIATDQLDPQSWRHREAEVDRQIVDMRAKLPLFVEQVKTVHEFLCEIRADGGKGPVRIGGYSHSTAHLLASRIIDLAAEGWEGCKAIGRRSRSDPRYLHAAHAAELFRKGIGATLPRPNDLLAQMQLERAAAKTALRERAATSANPTRQGDTIIQTSHVAISTPLVKVEATSVAADGMAASADIKKTRMKRKVAEPMIATHLMRRPHDTALEVSEAVGCSVGVVAESKAWKENQQRLELSRKEGVDPKAIKLDVGAVLKGSANSRADWHKHKIDNDALTDSLDPLPTELSKRIGDFITLHPDAQPEEVARACRCTAADVERRQATLDQLTEEQAQSRLEDEDQVDPTAKRQTTRKWVDRKV